MFGLVFVPHLALPTTFSGITPGEVQRILLVLEIKPRLSSCKAIKYLTHCTDSGPKLTTLFVCLFVCLLGFRYLGYTWQCSEVSLGFELKNHSWCAQGTILGCQGIKLGSIECKVSTVLYYCSISLVQCFELESSLWLMKP